MWVHPLTTIGDAAVGLVRVPEVKRHLAFLIFHIGVSDVERHPALFGGWRGLNGGVSEHGGRGRGLLQDRTVGFFQFSLFHQRGLEGAGRLDVSY